MSQNEYKEGTKSPLMKQLYDGNLPGEEEAQQLRDELFYNHAIHAYLTMLPALNVIGLRDGSEAAFGAGYNVLPIWKDRMDCRAWVPTPNADVIYSMSYLDLKETGPLVVAAPPAVIGMFTDFFQRTLTDVGANGPDRARGGLYLLLPPDYQGHVPKGYFTFTSPTYNVFLFFRTIMTQGADGPDPAPAVATAEKTRIYPLWEEEKTVKPMVFPNGSGKRVDMMYPVDSTYWDKLKAFVDYEPYAAIAPETRGVLAAIGIIKGKPFTPTARQKKQLEKAVLMAPKMILAQRMGGRSDKRNLYYEDRQYERVWAGADGRVHAGELPRHQSTRRILPICLLLGTGHGDTHHQSRSEIPLTFRDADGNILNGSHHYKLHLPAGIPAKLFWAVTAYNCQRRNDAGNPADVALDQRLQQDSQERGRVDRPLLWPDAARGRSRKQLDPDH